MGYGWDVDDDYLDDDDDEDEDEDEEDDEDEDGFGDDVEDGFGEEDNPDEEGEGGDKDGEGKEKEEKKKKEEEEKEKKDDKKDKKNKKEDPTNPKVLIKLAKRFGYPPIPMPLPCPECQKFTLFTDKLSLIFIRGVLSCIPYTSSAVPKDKVVKFVCLNKKCKSYWPTWGVKYSLFNGKFLKEKNIFHVVK